MKIKVDKNFTNGSQMARVKEDMADFKVMYTDGDLLRAFREATEFWKGYCADIIDTQVKAFPGGSYYGDATHFCVEMTLRDSRIAYYDIRFYCDGGLTVSTDPFLWEAREYKFDSNR